MHERGKSDGCVVPVTPSNKASAAEVGEERQPAKGNTDSKTRPGHSAGTDVSSALDRVRQVARRDKGARFTALLHHVTPGRLRAAYWAISPQAAPGVDGVTWAEYGQALEANLQDLYARVQSGRYRAKPSRRAYIVRRAALRRIPRLAGRNLEGGFWVCRLTRCRKADGTRACRMAVAW
jgi:RNA-directed DNA polymerase